MRPACALPQRLQQTTSNATSTQPRAENLGWNKYVFDLHSIFRFRIWFWFYCAVGQSGSCVDISVLISCWIQYVRRRCCCCYYVLYMILFIVRRIRFGYTQVSSREENLRLWWSLYHPSHVGSLSHSDPDGTTWELEMHKWAENELEPFLWQRATRVAEAIGQIETINWSIKKVK